LDVAPVSVIGEHPRAAGPAGGGLVIEAAAETLDCDEFAELTWLSRVRPAQSAVRNLSYITWTSEKSFFVSGTSAYVKMRAKLEGDVSVTFRGRNCVDVTL